MKVFAPEIFQTKDVFQLDKSPALCGYMARFPFYWGGAQPKIETKVVSTIEHSQHPVNSVLAQEQLSDSKKVSTDWFGPGRTNRVETDSRIKRGGTFVIPNHWKR